MVEIWKDVKGYEGLYQVSNLGRVKSLWFWNNLTQTRKYREKILKTRLDNKTKIISVILYKGGIQKTAKVYRLVLSAFTDKPIDYRLTVNHIDGNRLNNKLENLEWCSAKENIQKAFELGLYPTKKINITDKQTGITKMFISFAKASRFMNHNNGYISKAISKGQYENSNYSWAVA